MCENPISGSTEICQRNADCQNSGVCVKVREWSICNCTQQWGGEKCQIYIGNDNLCENYCKNSGVCQLLKADGRPICR